jgi:hypothetical protein
MVSVLWRTKRWRLRMSRSLTHWVEHHTTIVMHQFRRRSRKPLFFVYYESIKRELIWRAENKRYMWVSVFDYRRTTEVEADRTPGKCVLFTFFENIFLGALLAFLWLNLYEKRREKNKLVYFVFERVPRPRNVARRKEGGEDGHEGQREGQELNNRMCSDNLNLETTTQTFMLQVRPIPLCPWHPWKRSPHVQCVKQTLRMRCQPLNWGGDEGCSAPRTPEALRRSRIFFLSYLVAISFPIEFKKNPKP